MASPAATGNKLKRRSSLSDFSPKSSSNKEGAEQEWLSLVDGKVVLVVNVACLCGFTGQYQQLQQLQETYEASGFTVVGFPCNQFGKQEPWDHNEIEKFAEDKFNVTFPIFSKINVNGKQSEPLFEFLKSEAKGIFGTESVKWNFTKFLCGRDGVPHKRYGSLTKPMSIAKDIEKLLAAPKDSATTTITDKPRSTQVIVRQALI